MSFEGEAAPPLPPASVSAYLSRCGGCLSLVQLGEWMPSSASGGNDQSFISFLQCQSLQPSILKACSGSFLSSSRPMRRYTERWAGPPGRLVYVLLWLSLQPGGRSPSGALSLRLLGTAGSRRALGARVGRGSGLSWEWAGGMHSCCRASLAVFCRQSLQSHI